MNTFQLRFSSFLSLVVVSSVSILAHASPLGEISSLARAGRGLAACTTGATDAARLAETASLVAQGSLALGAEKLAEAIRLRQSGLLDEAALAALAEKLEADPNVTVFMESFMDGSLNLPTYVAKHPELNVLLTGPNPGPATPIDPAVDRGAAKLAARLAQGTAPTDAELSVLEADSDVTAFMEHMFANHGADPRLIAKYPALSKLGSGL